MMKERIEKYFEQEKEEIIFYNEIKTEKLIVAEILVKTDYNGVKAYFAVEDKEKVIKMSAGVNILATDFFVDFFQKELDKIYDNNIYIIV